MIQDAANARAQDRLAKIESLLARLGERIILLMQQYLTGEQVARIVDHAGTGVGQLRRRLHPGRVRLRGGGRFDRAAERDVPPPVGAAAGRRLMPFLEMGVANPQTLYMHVLQ